MLYTLLILILVLIVGSALLKSVAIGGIGGLILLVLLVLFLMGRL